MSHRWLPNDQDPRTVGDPQGEQATYREYLDYFRLTLGMKCAGLTPRAAGPAAVPPSTLSLLGLVRHMAKVEHSWFERVPRPAARTGATGAPRTTDFDFNGAEADQGVVEDAFASGRHRSPRPTRGSRRAGGRPRA